MRASSLTILTVFIATAFSLSTARAQTSALTPDPAQWLAVSATYDVPAPQGLEKLSHFTLTDAFVRKTAAGETQMRYTLPLELTGKPIAVIGSDNAGPQPLPGNGYSEMNCTGSDCNVDYPNLLVDPDDVRSFLTSQGISGLELDQRMQVFEAFRNGDPAGVIHIGAPKARCQHKQY